MDLAVANYQSNTVSVFRNTAVSGSITTASLAAKVDFATGTNPVAVGYLLFDEVDSALDKFGNKILCEERENPLVESKICHALTLVGL